MITIFDRPCPRGHGKMQKQPGLWVLQEVQRNGGLLNSGNLQITGRLLTMYVFTCNVCGHVELVNEEVT